MADQVGGFRLHAKQREANALLGGKATHTLIRGGSRSGKTFLIVRAIVARAVKSPGSRHAILRLRFNAVKASVVLDTFPKVMQLCFPGITATMNKTDWFAEFPNGAQVWFGGLDDKERTEKILGMEFATIFLNESSQIPWGSRNIAVTRLAQKCKQYISRPDGPRDSKGHIIPEESDLQMRMYYDCNPPDKSHWLYRVFFQKLDPDSKEPLRNPEAFATCQINPRDNSENLPAEYLVQLEGMSAAMRRRFLDGEFKDANPDALFTDEKLDRFRLIDQPLPEFLRIIIAVDPSGSDDADNADNDEIGIAVVALGADGVAYMLEDLSLKAGPAKWGRVVTDAFDRWSADKVVGEVNYGGAMVKHVIHTARPNTPFENVTATRGKHVRAEPCSALVEQGKVRMAGNHRKMEEELLGFSPYGYMGTGSPNRADAFVWGVTALFPGLTRGTNKRYSPPVAGSMAG